MIGGATAGNLFYLDRIIAGFASLALTAIFLFFAMSDLTYRRDDDSEEIVEALLELQHALGALALLLADNAVEDYKRIGRTMPCTLAELNKFEDDYIPLLNSLRVQRKEQERILQEIDKLRTRFRQGEGRRALVGNKL
jgi:hypothetical protein